VSGDTISAAIKAIGHAAKEDEPMITEYDTIAGDGDCGETLLSGVNCRLPASPMLPLANKMTSAC
jgi:triose/dihydroxyacetone kinase / FAD-AMP lyase (cyclizing)